MEQSLGFGVAGGLDPKIVRVLASLAEELGYTTFWANDTPTGDGLATLAIAAEATSTIRLGVGVIPLDRRGPEQIAADVEALGLPVDRLTLGVGSGAAKGGLAIVRAGAVATKVATGARVVVGALGPRMTALAGEVVDGVLLNWLTPSQAMESCETTRTAAREAGQPEPYLYGYVRTALGDAARARLESESERYGSYPAYAANFARMGVAAIDTTVSSNDPEDIRAGLAAFTAVLDETVVRAITGADDLESYADLIRAASPFGDLATKSA